MSLAAVPGPKVSWQPFSIGGHFRIARVDHWPKNVFVLPGIIIAAAIDPEHLQSYAILKVLVALVSVCLIASSNYTINELVDADSDRFHPVKRMRPVPSGKINIALAYAQWLALMLLGIAAAFYISGRFAIV